MDYTLGSVIEYILDLTDKKGSDLFQEPDILNVFQTATTDFLRERIPVIEATQQVTQDLQRLMLTTKEVVTDNPDNPYTVLSQIPTTCFYLFRVSPFYQSNVRARRPRLIRHGDLDALNADSHNKASKEYPVTVQYTDYLEIDSGFNDKAIGVYQTYLKKPTFAAAGDDTTRIVNLPDPVIEDIIIKTKRKLLEIIGDPRGETSFREEQTFGNINQ